MVADMLKAEKATFATWGALAMSGAKTVAASKASYSVDKLDCCVATEPETVHRCCQVSRPTSRNFIIQRRDLTWSTNVNTR